MNTIHKIIASTSAAVVLLSSSASAQLTIAGTATGCFYTGVVACSVGSSSTSLVLGNATVLTYTGGSFSATTGIIPPGTIDRPGTDVDNIGTLMLSSIPSGSTTAFGDYFLRVFVTFTSPNGTMPSGTSDAGDFQIMANGTRLDVLFPETYTIINYSGVANTSANTQRFGFRSTNLTSEQLIVGETEYLGYRIQCSDGTRRCAAPSTVVPEPATYAMMAAGLLGIFGVSRRRKTSV